MTDEGRKATLTLAILLALMIGVSRLRHISEGIDRIAATLENNQQQEPTNAKP